MRILCPAWLHRVGEGGVVDPADSLRVPPPEAMAWERFPLLSPFAPRSAAHLPYFTSRVSRQHFLLITPRRYCSAEGEVKAETQPSAVSGQPSGLKRTGDGRPETGERKQRKTIAGRWQRATGSDWPGGSPADTAHTIRLPSQHQTGPGYKQGKPYPVRSTQMHLVGSRWTRSIGQNRGSGQVC